MILLNGGVPIAFAGTEEPAAYGELISIGGLGPSVNGKLSSTIAEILQTKLSIDSSRFYIKFYDVEVNFLTYSIPQSYRLIFFFFTYKRPTKPNKPFIQ
jgi:phenylpyruvate tautomerase